MLCLPVVRICPACPLDKTPHDNTPKAFFFGLKTEATIVGAEHKTDDFCHILQQNGMKSVRSQMKMLTFSICNHHCRSAASR